MSKRTFANSAKPGEIDVHALYLDYLESKNPPQQVISREPTPRNDLYCGLTGVLIGVPSNFPGMFVTYSRF